MDYYYTAYCCVCCFNNSSFPFVLSWHPLGIIPAKAKFIKALIFDRIGEVWGWDGEASLIKLELHDRKWKLKNVRAIRERSSKWIERAF